MDLNALVQSASVTLMALGWKLAGAVALWLVGRWLIGFAIRLLGQALDKQQFDVTLTRYTQTALKIVLNVALVVAILGFFGVETTSFAALLAAGGVAIGVAWGGLLANFAAGVFLVFLRPFKVGDFVTAGGVTGTVDAIGLFGTVINTPDNVHTIIGNNKIFSDTIQNFSANPYRRVDLTAIINNSVDHRDAIRVLKERLAAIPERARVSARPTSTFCSSRQPGRCSACGLLQQRALLAGLLRYESADPRGVRRGGIPGADASVCGERRGRRPAVRRRRTLNAAAAQRLEAPYARWVPVRQATLTKLTLRQSSGRTTRLGHINFNTPTATGGSPTIFTSRPAPKTSVRMAFVIATHPPGV